MPSSQSVFITALCCLLFYLCKCHISDLNWGKDTGYNTYIEVSVSKSPPVIYPLRNETELRRLLSRYGISEPSINGGESILVREDRSICVSQINGKRRIALGIPIGINSASIEDLKALPGIGTELARRIVEYRNSNNGFRKIEELLMIKGIGKKRFERIKPFIDLN
jgi:competence ComEA-like helix-hairpin-helix protein